MSVDIRMSDPNKYMNKLKMMVKARMQGLRIESSRKVTFFFFLRFYLFVHERHRESEAETQAEREAGSTQGAQYGTRSWVSRITPWAEGGTKPLSHPIIIYIHYGKLNIKL